MSDSSVIHNPQSEQNDVFLNSVRPWLRHKELAAYKVPKRLEFRESLPKSLIGKVLKRQLRETAK